MSTVLYPILDFIFCLKSTTCTSLQLLLAFDYKTDLIYFICFIEIWSLGIEWQNYLRKVCLPVLEYVTEIYQTMIKTPRQELKQLVEELKQQVPEPMNSMLEKKSREDAIQKHKSRKQKETVIVTPTCTGKLASTYCTGLKYNYKRKIWQRYWLKYRLFTCMLNLIPNFRNIIADFNAESKTSIHHIHKEYWDKVL